MESSVNNGMCRCCASEGTFKDVKSAYHWMGEEEVYWNMLQECFDVALTTTDNGDDGGICEVCITQLRNASNFKKQVQHTEEQFKLRIQGKLFKSDIVKLEPAKDEESDNSDHLETEDFSGTEFEIPIKTETVEEPKPKKRAAAPKASTSRAKKAKANDGETSTKRNRPVIYSTNHDRPVHKETVLEKAISIANLKKAAAEKYATNARKLTRRLYVKNSATEKKLFESFRPVAYSADHEQAVHKETALEKAMNIAKLKKAAVEKYAAKKLKVEALNQKFMSNLATGKNRVESIRPGVDSTDHEQAVNEETALEMKITAQCATTKSRVSENKLTQYNRLNKCELEKHHNNIRQILNYSNATPINGHDGMGYRCCYCKNEFEEPADLKEHTLELHHDDDVAKASFMEKRMTLRGFLVKLDITALRCNECMIHIDTLDKLVEHIANLHNVTMYTGIKDLIIPFKFDSDTLTCFICLNVFYNFKMLLQHMNIHYRNYICDICGAGYINLVRLFWHRRNHDVGPFTCDYCPSVYKTIQYKREHEKVAHFGKPAKNKCGICGKKFKYHYLKVTHISEVHGVDTRTDCQVCGKTMACARKLRQHVNRTHLLYKRHRCTLCDMACYSKSELRAHMSKHDTTDERFICNDCSRPYRSRKALLNHFKHAHADQGESSIIILRTK